MTRGTYSVSQFMPSTCCSTHASRLSLNIRQQPLQARVSTNNERDRRPIDPPPIIQITISDGSPSDTTNLLQSPCYFMCANLAHARNDDEIYTPNHNALSGQTVSSMFKFKDTDNQDGGFFVFGDLSVKVEGQFRLKVCLFEITANGATHIKSVFTEAFTVYPTKSFPGAMEPTFLSRCFSDQGARIRIRKENRHPTASSKRVTQDAQSAAKLSNSPEPKRIKVARQPSIASSSSNSSVASISSSNQDNHEKSPRCAYNVSDSAFGASVSPQPSPALTLHHLSDIPVSPPHQPYDKPNDLCLKTPRSELCHAMPSPPLRWSNPLPQPQPEDNASPLNCVQLPPLRQLLHPKPNSPASILGDADAAAAMLELAQYHRDQNIDLRRPW